MYITMTDFRGQRYVATVEVEDEDPVRISPEVALMRLRNKIVNGEPIACEIVHSNNKGQTLTIFHGPVTLSYHYSSEDK